MLRDIGIAPATRFAEELAQARETRAPSRAGLSLAAKLRIALIGAIVLLILLRYLGIY
jgi:hypothetical protein